jgi:hypothetical protein
MSAFGGKADMAIAVQMSAYDPRKTLGGSAFSHPSERPVCSTAIVGGRHSPDGALDEAPSAPV